jgi:hypothetical protein
MNFLKLFQRIKKYIELKKQIREMRRRDPFMYK